MYNSKDRTVDKDLTFLSYNQTINDEFTIDEILKSPLWISDYAYIFEDVGITGNKNSYWVNQGNNFSVVTDLNGTTLTEIGPGNYAPSSVADSTSWNDHLTFDVGVYVEFDIENTSNGIFRIYYDTDSSMDNHSMFYLKKGHYKFFVDNGVIRYWINGIEQGKKEKPNIKGSLIFVFLTRNDELTSMLKYKNFKIYRNTVIKAIPLFNCDIIQSNNPNDIILDDNKCVILNNDNNTIITAKSDDIGSMHIYDVILHAYAPTSLLVDNLSIYCIVYDEFMNPLTNTLINVEKDGTVIGTVKTDYSGVCEYKLKDAGSYKFIYGEKESETIRIL